MKKWLMVMSIVTAMFIIGACGDDNAENNGSAEDTGNAENTEGETASENGGGEAESAEEMPEPDLEDVPDVVAEVNGEDLTKEEFEQVYSAQFQQVAMMQQMSGEEIDQDELKQQVADGLVSERLLSQEADNRDISASEEEVDEMIGELVEANGLESEEEFFTAMEESGTSEDEVRTLLSNQVKVEQLISEETGDVEPTEEEMQEAYDQQIEARGEMETEGEETEPPEFEEVQPQIEEQLIQQEEAEAAQTLADELREDADVTINV